MTAGGTRVTEQQAVAVATDLDVAVDDQPDRLSAGLDDLHHHFSHATSLSRPGRWNLHVSRRLRWVTEPGYRRGKAMRAARRIFVLAGILAMAVFAPITWSQAGAQTADGGDASPSTFTFIKIMCADFGAIPANVNTPNNLTSRPDGTHLGASVRAPRGRRGVRAGGLREGRRLAVRPRIRREPRLERRRRSPCRSLVAPGHGHDHPERRASFPARRAQPARQRGRAAGLRLRHDPVRHRQHQRRQPRVPRQWRPADLRGLQRRRAGDDHEDGRGLRADDARGRLPVRHHVRQRRVDDVQPVVAPRERCEQDVVAALRHRVLDRRDRDGRR